MILRNILYCFFTVSFCYIIAITGNGCAQIGSIPGGARDSLPPRLISSTPKQPAVNVKDNRISLTFDEYIELQELQNNLIISPYPKKAPEISSRLKTVSVKLKDSLLPNTTYSIQFGGSIRDVNENNPAKGFTYVFSTGSYIDSFKLSGKLVMAETGKPDSTLLILLYRDATDSSVEKQKPNYISFINGDGSFEFKNLPAGNFSVYALKDGDGGKTYNSKTEIFGFIDSTVTVSEKTAPVTLYAYAEEKKDKAKPVAPPKSAVKKLRYTAGITGALDIRKNLEITFSNKLKLADSTKLVLTDTNYKPLPVSFSIDSNLLVVKSKWAEDFDYRLIIQKDAVRDIADSSLSRTDTLRFKTKTAADYGNVTLRFNKIDSATHLVLQFIQNDQVAETFPLTGREWKYKLFPPGEYEIRVLYDSNNNGKWDPGSYSKKKQPEKVVSLPKKFSVKENWDNESDINL